MLGSTNLFRPPARGAAALDAIERGQASRGLDDLSAARANVEAIRRELPGLTLSNAIAFGVDRTVMEGAIDNVKAYLRDRVPRLDAAAAGGDVDAAHHYMTSSRNLLAFVRGEHPAADVAANVGQLIEDTAADTKAAAVATADVTPWVVGGALLLVVVLYVVPLLRR